MYRTFRWCRLYKESRENVIVSFIVAVPVDGSFAVFSTFLGALSLHTLKMRLACSVINGCLDGWMLTMTTLKERGLHQYSIRNSKRAQWLFGVHGMDCHFWIKAPTLHAWPTTMYILPGLHDIRRVCQMTYFKKEEIYKWCVEVVFNLKSKTRSFDKFVYYI